MITIADLEAIAAQVEGEESQERERLMRLIRAYARILAVREPGVFTRRALEYSDEDGSWDNSYPPDQQYKDHTGPRTMKVAGHAWHEIATSTGFYYDWRATTKDGGLYIAPDGSLYGCTISGTGEFGRFAARPGNCNVMLTLEYDTLNSNDVKIARLRDAESALREKAFPHVAALGKAS